MIELRNARLEDINQLREVKPTLTEEQIVERINIQAENLLEFLVLEDEGVINSYLILKWQGKETHPEYPDIEDLHTKHEERKAMLLN